MDNFLITFDDGRFFVVSFWHFSFDSYSPLNWLTNVNILYFPCFLFAQKQSQTPFPSFWKIWSQTLSGEKKKSPTSILDDCLLNFKNFPISRVASKMHNQSINQPPNEGEFLSEKLRTSTWDLPKSTPSLEGKQWWVRRDPSMACFNLNGQNKALWRCFHYKRRPSPYKNNRLK